MNTVDLELITLLQEELALPALAIDAAIDYAQSHGKFLPMVLWERGLLTLPQLEVILLRIFS
ncbi:DUF2949 domain-containing protein [Trichothermofontia sp.]